MRCELVHTLEGSLPRHPVPTPTNVRYASNGDRILRPSEMTTMGHKRTLMHLLDSLFAS